jgi:predicted DNA-binding transcriptional regulator YafY
MDLVRQACWREEALAIRYTDKAGAVSERTILPLAIVYTEGTLTVLAWCCLREAFRMFRSDGISELQLAGISFRPRRVVLLREYLAELRGREGTGGDVSLNTATK